MARDEALLASAEAGAPPALRLYGWTTPTLSLGAHQPSSDADQQACRDRGVALVRRPTGGGAVLHDRELTYSVTGRIGEAPFPSSVVALYDAIAAALIAGLRVVGVAAEASRGAHRGRAPADCFGAPSARELVVGGRKLVGSAQVRRRGAFLQHGSILLDLDAALLARVLKPAAGREGVEAVPGASPAHPSATTLLALLGREVPREELGAAIAEGFRISFGARLEGSALDGAETEAAARLRAFKYLDALWTLEGRVRPLQA